VLRCGGAGATGTLLEAFGKRREHRQTGTFLYNSALRDDIYARVTQ